MNPVVPNNDMSPELMLQDMIDEFSGGKDGIDEAAFLKIMNATDE
jgi:hypothetical protein